MIISPTAIGSAVPFDHESGPPPAGGSGHAAQPHRPVHAETLPSTISPSWPEVSIPAFGTPAMNVSPPTPATTLPHNAPAHVPHHPYHANTLPAPSQTSAYPLWAQQQSNAGNTPTTPTWYHHPYDSATNSMRPPMGEASSYYSDHPNLSATSTPVSTGSGSSVSQWPQTSSASPPPAPHHANSWGPGSPALPNSWQNGPASYQTPIPSSPPMIPSSPPLQSAQNNSYVQGGSYSPNQYTPHHAYSVGPGVSPPLPPRPTAGFSSPPSR